MHRGFIKLDRNITESQLWQSSGKFDTRSAWVDLLLQTWWKNKKYRIGWHSYDLKPGEIMTSCRFLAKRWGWSKNKVNSFLSFLQKRDSIRTQKGTHGTLITICNWRRYQTNEKLKETPLDKNRDTKGTPQGHERDTTGTRKGQNQEVKEVKEVKNKPSVGSQKTEPTGERKSSSPKKKSDPRVKEIMDFWCLQFEEVYKTEPILKFGRDGKLIKDLLGYVDNNSKIPDDCKVVFMAGCMVEYLEEQEKREEKFKNATIPGFYAGFEKIITSAVDWDNPKWEEWRKEYELVKKGIKDKKSSNS